MAEDSVEETGHTDATTDVGAHADDRAGRAQYTALAP